MVFSAQLPLITHKMYVIDIVKGRAGKEKNKVRAIMKMSLGGLTETSKSEGEVWFYMSEFALLKREKTKEKYINK